MKKALIFGASGQMGSYLWELLHEKGYEIIAPPSWDCDFEMMHEDRAVANLLKDEAPIDEIYNLAAINYAPDSWERPEAYLEVNGMAVLRLLEMVSRYTVSKTKFFQAGSAEVFEKATIQQAEDTNRLPANPYGLGKMMAMEGVRIYREQYNMFACTGIFFNAESPRRSKMFFAEKVAHEVAILKKAFDTGGWIPISLGRLDARRDWGWAPEYVEVAWRMLQLDKPMDFVIGTGETHTCRDFVYEALLAAGLPDVDKNFNKYVKYDPTVDPSGNCMRAQPSKAKRFLDWEAQYKFKDVVRMLVKAEMEALCENGLTRTTR